MFNWIGQGGGDAEKEPLFLRSRGPAVPIALATLQRHYRAAVNVACLTPSGPSAGAG